ncbi:MAG TPA: hypothetical protein VFV19_01610 [Candidatus Polarisedimenticolaceae bacterium]|nr:hypothetical protein [Candidatus Polarisedimenticolaceae bacterium]
MSAPSTVEIGREDVVLGAGGVRAFRIAAVLGIAGLGGAAALAPAVGWDRFYASYLTSFLFFLSLALGSLVFVLIQHVTRAGWSVVIRRFAEVFAPNVFLPMAVLVLPVLAGLHALYPWTDAAKVAADPALHAKAPWLNDTFFSIRAVLYFAVWTILSVWFHRRSVEQDTVGTIAPTRAMEAASTTGLVLFAFSVTFFAFDFIMSLTPHWYSTIFGVYFFAGCILGCFALLLLVSAAVQRGGRLVHAITAEHYHDLGKLLFAFTIFWAYIGFSQYMLMWYANLPEETAWYAARQHGSWTTVSVVLLFGHFFLPFLLLMSRNVKRRRPLIVTGAVWMLVMQWLDIYWLVMPSKTPDGFSPSLVDVATFVGIGGIFFAVAIRRLGASALVPVKDPRLGESLGFENV